LSGAPASRRVFLAGFALLGLSVLGPALREAPRHKSWDYGPHHALTRALARGLAQGHVPRYLVGVSTGDSPFEMYPLPAYALAAGASLLLGGDAQAPLALLLLAAACHVVIAALVARLASHFAPLPLAFGLGVAAFFDLGSFESGAANTILEVGLLHGALAQCLLLLALDMALVIASAGPRRGRVVGLWLAAAAAAAAHPSSLLFLLALLFALLAGAALARSPAPRKPLAAALHVGVGVMLSAWVWMPYAARVLAHGLHFAYPAPPLSAALGELSGLRQPPTSFPLLLALGYAGLAGALLRRRAASLALACLTATLLLGWSELPHRLFFDWQPHALARLQSFRLLTLVRPLLFAAAALPLAAAWRFVRARTPLLGLAFPAGTLALIGAGLVCAATQSGRFPTGGDELRAAAQSQVEDPAGFEQLLTWAAAEQRARLPGRFARLMWSGSENGIYHVTAETGLPAFFVGDGVALLLRERIEDNSKQSLRRFNVRWIASRGEQPGERRFGSYVVRELPEWDGQLARIEKGAGSLRVLAREDERIEVELTDTDAPALVALGLGYYGRWRARREDGSAVPVHALPATPGGSVRVLAAWLAPGKTVFQADAALASDGLGRAPTAVGLAVAALSLFAGRRSRLAPRRARAIATALALAPAAWALLLAARPPQTDKALRLLRGIGPEAQVEARVPGGGWTACRFGWLRRDFECPGLGRIGDGVGFVVRDHPSSTPFLTPAIVAHPYEPRVEYRVRLARRLAGSHWAAGWGAGGGTLRCGGRELELQRRRQPFELEGGAAPTECELLLRTRGRVAQGATLVRQDAVDLDRSRDVPWAPDEPPAR
jgi:hypothetical protein